MGGVTEEADDADQVEPGFQGPPAWTGLARSEPLRAVFLSSFLINLRRKAQLSERSFARSALFHWFRALRAYPHPATRSLEFYNATSLWFPEWRCFHIEPPYFLATPRQCDREPYGWRCGKVAALRENRRSASLPHRGESISRVRPMTTSRCWTRSAGAASWTWRSSASARSPRLQESSRWGLARAPGRQRRCNAPVRGGPTGKADRRR
jgi:hypothetical protein